MSNPCAAATASVPAALLRTLLSLQVDVDIFAAAWRHKQAVQPAVPFCNGMPVLVHAMPEQAVNLLHRSVMA